MVSTIGFFLGLISYPLFEPSVAHLFFLLVSRHYERGGLLVTSNHSVDEWGKRALVIGS